MEIYRKIYIKSEADLPKETGEYIAYEKTEDGDKIHEVTFDDIFPYYKKLWRSSIDWYLQPVEQEKPIYKHNIGSTTNFIVKPSESAEDKCIDCPHYVKLECGWEPNCEECTFKNYKESHQLTAVSMLEKHGFDFYKFDMDSEYSAKNLLKAMEEYASQKHGIGLPNDEQVMIYFNNHITNFIWEGGIIPVKKPVMTRSDVLKLVEWIKSQINNNL